jgi:hypothetical protein
MITYKELRGDYTMLRKKSMKKLSLTLGLYTIANLTPTVVIPIAAYAKENEAPKLSRNYMSLRGENSTLTIKWERATDDKTPQNKLKYYLYQAENNDYGNEISDWETKAKLLNEGGSYNINQWSIIGINLDSYYTFMLIVEDEDGNKTAYSEEAFGNSEENKAEDSEAPKLSKKNMTVHLKGAGATITWEKATDDKTPQNKLKYYLYEAENNNYGTKISDWESKAQLLNQGGSYDINEWNITGLNNDSGYTFMLVVEDEDRNKTLYNMEIFGDASAVFKEAGDEKKFGKAKAKTLEFISKYNFKSNMEWHDFTSTLKTELSDCGITGVGDDARINMDTGRVKAVLWLQMGKDEYVLPFTTQASDIQVTSGNTTNAKWHKNSDGIWTLMINEQAATGWNKVDGKWYYLNQNGIMKTGWFKDIDGKWYFLKDNGEMACDETVGGYYVNSSGVWVE